MNYPSNTHQQVYIRFSALLRRESFSINNQSLIGLKKKYCKINYIMAIGILVIIVNVTKRLNPNVKTTSIVR